MAKGRKKLPDKVKQLQGTLQPCRASGDKPIFNLVLTLPPPPEWLGETAKVVYNDVVKSMIELRLVNNTNLPLIVSYAHMIGIHHDAEQAMQEKGRYMPIRNEQGVILRVNVAPHHRVSMEALDRALRIASEFGITPSAQTKIMSLIKPPEEVDPFDLI